MILKQYTINVPADYDMQVIPHRAARKGGAFDSFPELGLKAFMIREKGCHGADGNQYAPYLVGPRSTSMRGASCASTIDR